jgi:tetratricopeptide (TPR) repeat protein
VIVSFAIDDLSKSIPGVAGLGELTGDALVEALKNLLGTAAEGAEIRVENRMVILDYGDLPEARISDAQKLCEKASRQADKGEWSKAATTYRRALEANPLLQSARRALAMALMEAGKPEEGEDVLLDALKVDPRDSEALVILGNRYARQGGRNDVALSLVRRACEVAPDDAVAHNSLGALLLEQDQAEEAVVVFNSALALDPTLANAWYGRSVAEIALQRWKAARDSLQQMFAVANLADRRIGTMLQEARDSFRRVTNIIGNDRTAESLKAANDLAALLGEASGHAVTVREIKLDGGQASRSIPAWVSGDDRHLVELEERLPAEMVKHHLVCRECSRMLIETAARKNDQARTLTIPADCLETLRKDLASDIRRIAERNRFDPAKLADVTIGLGESTIRQLHLVIQDVAIERRLAQIPELREAQFCSLLLQVHNSTEASLRSQNRPLIPPQLNKLRDTLSAVMAILLDRLSHGATDYTAEYNKAGVLLLARKIEAMAWEHSEHNGGDTTLDNVINESARLLGVRDWYEWHPP